MKFTFICEDMPGEFDRVSNVRHDGRTKVTFSAEALPEILQEFANFLRGAGFHPRGDLVFEEGDQE